MAPFRIYAIMGLTMDFLTSDFTDWVSTFYPAVVALLRGSPPHIYNAPWTLFPLVPFALIPMGRVFLLVATFLAFAFTAWRLGVSPRGLLLLLIFPPTLIAAIWGNVEWLTLLGLAINPAIGLCLLAIKPQMTLAVMAFWIIERWQENGWRGVLRLILPLTALTGISFLFFGFWLTTSLTYLQFRGATFDASWFPNLVPVGVLLFVGAWRTHDIRYAIAASPFLFPVLTVQCWLVVLLALVMPPKASRARR